MKLFQVVYETTSDDWKTSTEEINYWVVDEGYELPQISALADPYQDGTEHFRRLIKVIESVPVVNYLRAEEQS